MKRILSEHKSKIILLTIVFLFYLFISANVPYMLDDWNWGIDAGINSFVTADQNSRYAGNLVVLILTRSVFLKNILMAAVFTVIPHMMVRILGVKDDRDYAVMYLLANVLILMMDVSIWRQTYGWVSGFANFVVSNLFMCGHILILKKYLFSQTGNETFRGHTIKATLIFLFALTGQLFIENATIYYVVVYFCANIYCLIRNRKLHPYLFAAFGGTGIGVAVMFSSSLYDTLIATGTAYEGYRELTVDTSNGLVGLVCSIIKNFCYQSAQQVTVEFYVPAILILLTTTVLLILKKTRFSILLAVGNVGVGLVYVIVWGIGVFVPYRYKILFGLAYYLAIFVEYIYIYIYQTSLRVGPLWCMYGCPSMA